MNRKRMNTFIVGAWLVSLFFIPSVFAQLIDNTQTLNPINAGINKSLTQEVGAEHGDVMTPNSSVFIIKRDPFRAIRRGRQLFMRKFTSTLQKKWKNNSLRFRQLSLGHQETVSNLL